MSLRLVITTTFLLARFIVEGAAADVGIVIHRDQFTAQDEFAHATEYRRMDVFDAVTNFTPSTGPKFSLMKAEIVRIVPYPIPDSVLNIVQELDLAPTKAIASELTGLIQKFPRSRKYLNPHLVLLQGEIDRFRAGQVKFEGRWLPTRKALEALVATRKAEAAAQEKAEKERVESLRMAEQKRQMQEAAVAAAASEAAAQARVQQARMGEEAAKKAREIERRAEEDRKIAEELRLKAALTEAQVRENERLRTELQAAEERREAQLLQNAAARFQRVDRFRGDWAEPVIAR